MVMWHNTPKIKTNFVKNVSVTLKLYKCSYRYFNIFTLRIDYSQM